MITKKLFGKKHKGECKIRVEKKQGKKSGKDSRSESNREKMRARESETVSEREREREGWTGREWGGWREEGFNPAWIMVQTGAVE